MATTKKKAGRPKVKDKRIRVSFMAHDSVYQKAIKMMGKEKIDKDLELTLQMLSVYGCR